MKRWGLICLQASTQNSESDTQKEEKLVMEKKIADLEDKLRVFILWKELHLINSLNFQQFNISNLTTDQVRDKFNIFMINLQSFS